MLPPFPPARHVKGFSLVEILLTMALISIVLAISVPSYRKLQSANDLSVAMSTLSQALRLAELKAQAVVEGSGWGVHAETGAVIIFKGSSFASRDQTRDEVFSFSGSIAITAPADVFFAPLYGTPVAPAVWELSGIGETRSVSVNSLGILSY